MARPTIAISPEQKVEVETLAALLSQDQIADYLGICRNTFRAICARDEEVSARYKRGKAKAIAHVAQGLLMKARNGDTASSIFYLKTQGGWRETERVEHALAAEPEARSARQLLVARLDRLRQRQPGVIDAVAIEAEDR